MRAVRPLSISLSTLSPAMLLQRAFAERIGIENSKLTYKPAGKEPFELVQDMKDHTDAIKLVLDALVDEKHGVISDMSEIDAVGHRVVHGGENLPNPFCSPMKFLKPSRALTILHPCTTRQISWASAHAKAIMPNTPMVGVFDTAFHQTMPKEAFIYGLPYEAYTDNMVRRYGFHGTSHNYVTLRAIEMLGKPAEETKIITCHLGNGSSISAVKGGKCIDTSMGLTPLEGVPMGTRCGDMDPAIVIYLMKKLGLDAKGMDNYMNKKSGMLGISGVSSDFRDLGAAAAEGNERAELALRTFAYKVKKYIGAYAAALNGVDAIVFTAGVGENDKGMRERILNGLDYLGVEVDFELNRNCPRGENVEISKPGSKVKVFVIPTDEELMIAKDTARLAK